MSPTVRLRSRRQTTGPQSSTRLLKRLGERPRVAKPQLSEQGLPLREKPGARRRGRQSAKPLRKRRSRLPNARNARRRRRRSVKPPARSSAKRPRRQNAKLRRRSRPSARRLNEQNARRAEQVIREVGEPAKSEVAAKPESGNSDGPSFTDGIRRK